jgi:aryl-alcohol dehydrogenase-like predicted oxidoreductase
MLTDEQADTLISYSILMGISFFDAAEALGYGHLSHPALENLILRFFRSVKPYT